MARSVPPPLMAHLRGRATTVCLCWKAQRQDGLIFGFTDHDTDLTFDGVTYKAMTSFTASAVEDQLGLAVSNMDLVGAISSDAVTNADLEDGRWDECVVILYLVNWADAGNIDMRVALLKGTIGQVQVGDLAFQAELRSLGQHFAQYVGSLISPKCRSNLGDQGTGLEGGCRFALPAPVDATITAVTDRTTFSASAVGSFPFGEGGSISMGYWAFGVVAFTSGGNKGLSLEVLDNDALNFVMRVPFPEDISIGDTFTLQLGCDKTPETCRQNFDNLVNFRGEPYVPGTDFVFKVNGE